MRKVKNIFFAAALFFVFASGVRAQDANHGTIREISGTVEIKQPGSAVWETASRGQIIRKDAVVSTSFKSSALIVLGNTVLTVRPLTRLTLAELAISSGNEEINVNLQTGRVKVEVNPPSGTRTVMKVQSPIATASVRGTAFEFDANNLEVYHGTVEFSGSTGSELLIDEGRLSFVDDDTGRAVLPEIAAGNELRPELPFGTDNALQEQGRAADAPASGGTGIAITVGW